MKRPHLVRDIVELLALTIVIFLALRFTIQTYSVNDPGMTPALNQNSYILVNKVAYLFHPPERSDVIVFHFPYDTTKVYIKRVIGIPGDKVSTDGSHVWVNGVQLNEPYVNNPFNPSAREWTVPQDQYFVMGDNRQEGEDSRKWGTVPKNYIIGKATLVFWPSSQWRSIPNYPDVFKQIK
ncbi:MAG: signal peptidase I [Ktedonobacteraceae bacterium]|nr:signal peptidase I [Ktedonobacteraceae bacterium]MBO0795421.1 signal peptidase I [Ktedonobacteraceae bacterium]